MNYIYLLSNIILNYSCINFCYKLSNDESSSKNKKIWIALILMTLIGILQDMYSPRPIKLIISIVALTTIIHLFIDNNIKKTITILILLELEIMISELIFLGFISIFSIDYESKIALYSCNLFVATMITLISNSRLLYKTYNSIIESIHKIKEKEIFIYSITIVFILIISTIESYLNLPILVVLITNTIISFSFIIIISKFIMTRNKYNNINNKYQTSINSLKEYETMIDKFRVNTHENKNELMTIRNMVKNKDKNIIEYIDALVDNKIKDNEKIMYQTSKIPEGGLRATIYSKLCVMDKYKIKYKLDIAKNVRTVDLINLDEEIILNICKILGVFMDNAIEEVRNLKKKEIRIELYVIENKLYIDITNNFKGNIDINKIGHERNTSKGEEHGYGLLLVNKIVKENSKYLHNEKSINGNYFTQTLKIKIK